jgi:N-acetylmuramoyl-L-alanine amidase
MIPEQEAALRTPEYQDAYARALVEGLEDFFRDVAR